MIKGSCLCGGVRFEVSKIKAAAEICHCNRCRKLSGSNSLVTVLVDQSDFTLTSGEYLVNSFDAPILYRKPAYTASFCTRCGCPVPKQDPQEKTIEIPMGLFDNDPGIKPDKHIFVEFVPAWDKISDDLPQYDFRGIYEHRYGKTLPKDFKIVKHASEKGASEKD